MRRGSVAFALCFGLSCGLLPGDPARVGASDGVSGFGAAEPVELCVGSARVVPPGAASGAAGVCVASGSAGLACDGDDACVGLERCICGRCIVRACEGATSCGDGEVCRGRRCTRSCATDAACAQGERCVSGGCALACSEDAACHHGERCDALDDVCVTKTCGGGASCGLGEVCEREDVTGEVHEPAVDAVASLGVAFVEVRSEDGSSAIHRARVAEVTRWVSDPEGPVIALAGERAGAPSVLTRDDGAIELYFARGDDDAIARAVSIDGGASFLVDADPWLVPEAAWEDGHVGSPSAFVFRGERFVAYEGGRGAGIGLARVTDAGADRVAAGPIASAGSFEDPVLWRGVTRVGSPAAIVVGDVLRIYATVRGAEGSDAVAQGSLLPADVNDSVGLVATTDLATFVASPAGPVFARVANLRAYLGEREPAVRMLPSGAELYIVGTDAAGARSTGLFRAATRGAAAR